MVNIAATSKETIVFIALTEKKIRMEVIRSLISSGALSDRALYVCEKCAEHAEKNLLENEKINGMKHLFSDVYKFNLSRHISCK